MDIEQLPIHTFNEIQHFFTVYKSLEGKNTVVRNIDGHEKALNVIKHCIEEYDHYFCGKRE
ncbi:Inorganic pyrophosphatase [bioreactor metagenome]|uniref:inorganic diphosphatase n=1 Tax=bioreactor metagenome TaxID=1076179 RepID=A0A645GDY4_9ZZZZ